MKIFKSRKVFFLIAVIYLVDFFLIFKIDHPKIFLDHTLAYPIYAGSYIQSLLNKKELPVRPKSEYKIAIVGDSMVAALKDAEFQLQNDLLPDYQYSKIRVLNYGFASTNILSVSDRLKNKTTYMGNLYPPLLSYDFDLVFIESFGNNPLSQFPLEEGLSKQIQALDEIVGLIKEARFHAKIIFLAVMAPSQKYGEGVITLSLEERIKWAAEREKYIENHIQYAKTHDIALIDLYSQTKSEEAAKKYIHQGDHIHPSNDGLLLINKEIADFITRQRLLPL